MKEFVWKGTVASTGSALIGAGMRLIETDPKMAVLMIGLGVVCLAFYTHLVEKQAVEKAFVVLNQALDERLKKAKEEAAKKQKKK